MKESDSSDDQGQCSSEMSFCEICMEAKAKSETRSSTSKCSHIYCSECITKYIEAKIQEKISMITCPESTCKETLEPYLCRDMISGQVLDRWENALCESSVLASHKIYCPFKDCSVLLVNDDDGVILRSTECPHCNRLFCAQCEVPWHSDLTCDDFQEIKKGGKDDMLLISLAKDQKWTRCPSCRFYVEKVQGCAHITCRYVTITIAKIDLL
ncbi:hypothetical protein MKW94_003853 [Papaver nudicaule]|uniref:RBR-type E3 ubiquitin transferase n=1 Tax=Papaver nudicaule TaxID=74823 RepID=A0AA41W296_PAPNU|nr:hypothetical protein [Papaver nudicaule]